MRARGATIALPLPLLVQAAGGLSLAWALALPDGLFAALVALLLLWRRIAPALLPFLVAGQLAAALPRLDPRTPRSRIALAANVRVVTPSFATRSGRRTCLVRFEEAGDRALAGNPTALLSEPARAPPRRRGERWCVQGSLEPAPPPRNPGVRRELALLLATQVEPPRDDGSRLAAGWRALRSAIDRLANAIDARLHARLEPGAAALAAALVLGRADELERPFKDGLRAIGAWHFLAVSGSHVALVALLVNALLAALRLPQRPRLVATLAVVAGYTALSGGEAPALRSTIACLGAGIIVGRPRLPSPTSWLAAAFLLLVALDPASALEAGFQLSFVAVVALAVAFRHGPARSPRGTGTGIDLRAPLLRAARCAIAAGIATAPLTAWHFGTVAVLAPLATLLLGPIVTGALTVALLAAASTALPAVCTAPFGPLLSLFGFLLEQAANWGDRLPGTPLPVTVSTTLPVVLLVAAWLPLLARRPAAALALTLAALVAGLGARPRTPSLTLLAVGHGQSALVRGAGRCDLFDAGGDGSLPVAGVVRALHQLEVARIDALVLSHLDDDHAGYAPALLREFEVGELCLARAARAEFELATVAHVAELRTAAAARGIPVRFLAAGERIGPHSVIWPPDGRSFAQRNDGSLALRARVGALELLLPGDLEEFPLLDFTSRIERPVDLLLLPHHGNSDPGIAALLARARPELVLVSREERVFSAATRALLRASGIPWLSTGHGGAIAAWLPPKGAFADLELRRADACR